MDQAHDGNCHGVGTAAVEAAVVIDAEHDRFERLPVELARARCTPELARIPLLAAIAQIRRRFARASARSRISIDASLRPGASSPANAGSYARISADGQSRASASAMSKVWCAREIRRWQSPRGI